MKDMFYTLLRKSIEEIYVIENGAHIDDRNIPKSGEMVIDTINKMMDLSATCRLEGLLALEEKVMIMKDLPGYKYLNWMILLVVDGTDPNLVEEMAIMKYISARLTDYAALQYLIMMYGTLAIQNGENPRIIEESLCSMLTPEIADEYSRLKEATEKRNAGAIETQVENIDMTLVEKVCEEETEAGLTPGDDCYYIVNMLDWLLHTPDDRAIQRILQDVDNGDLAVALKVLGRETRRKVMNNLSKRLAVMIAEEMEYMGPVMVTDIGKSCKTILNVIMKLVGYNEIVYYEADIIQEMARVFVGKQENGSAKEVVESEEKLYDLWREYRDQNERRI